LCETKPIARDGAAGGRPERAAEMILRNKANGRGTGSRRPGGELCETKPISEAAGGTQVPVTKGIRRDSFELRPCENEANFGGRRHQPSRSRERTTVCPTVRNKANLWAGRPDCRSRIAECGMKNAGQCVKQSQFPGRRWAQPTLQVWIPAPDQVEGEFCTGMTRRDQRSSAFISG